MPSETVNAARKDHGLVRVEGNHHIRRMLLPLDHDNNVLMQVVVAEVEGQQLPG